MKKFASCSPACWLLKWVFRVAFTCFVFLDTPLFAQLDSVDTQFHLPEATIVEHRFSPTGFGVWKADSLPTAAVMSLSHRLFLENGLQVRQNAPGTLATLSARGAGPNRTSVCWNGLNLQSPMNGVVDAALLPLWPGDSVSVLQGGNSAAQGSGAMGGTVLIDVPTQQSRQGFSGNFGVEAGSYSDKAFQASADLAKGTISSRFRAHWQQAKNDFSFPKKGLTGTPFTAKQVNNFAEVSNIQQFNQWAVNPKNLLKTAAWFQKAYRQIPPATTESAANTWQRDQSFRAVATWECLRPNHATIRTRVAWQDEAINFNFAEVAELSRAQSTSLNVEWQRQQNRQIDWRVGATAQYIRAKADGYQSGNSWFGQTRLAGFAQAVWRLKHVGKLSALFSEAWAAEQATPFTGTLGWESNTSKAGLFRGHFSRNVNLPTFNDRFWKNLGNPDLLPEKGYSIDAGWVLNRNVFSFAVTAFQLTLDDWILWQPGPDGFFRPANLRKVSSRGLESASTLTFDKWGLQWRVKGRIQWSETVNRAVYGGAESVLGKQLPYTPQLSASSGIWAKRGKFTGAYLHQYTGARFITTDNQSKLPAFQTGTLILRGEMPRWRRSRSLSIDLALDNIWDVSYSNIAYRPMPGRNWRAGVVFGW